MLTSRDYIKPEHKELIDGFVCYDEPSVELFLKEHALQLHRYQSARTRLYFDENQNLIGFFTLYNDLVHIYKSQRTKHEWNLPRDIGVFPGIKLHYFGCGQAL